MDIKQLDRLYHLYNFQLLNISDNNVRVYLYSSKYFSNSDIVQVGKDVSPEFLQDLRDKVNQLGFSVNIRDYKTLEDAEINLFDGFFDIKNSNAQLRRSYQEYSKKIEDLIFGKYEYINSDYYDIVSDTLENDSIVTKILSDLKKPGPVLIMVEAAAGFGKTSTAYEVLSSLVSADNSKIIPLFTELSRSRQASIFRYVLYDEISRRFSNLNLELVNKHIIEGRIPVIIDGFDELLKTKGLEKGEEKFSDAEPMLETIKELLTGNAKILLTTRRTALFSDNDFFSWINKNQTSFSFNHYSITEPSISDWIPANREKQLQRAGLNLKSISNPVLLSFIRSMTDDNFEKSLSNIDFIIEEYIKKLMDRERIRQDLQMDVAEQRLILKIIANHFTNYDITSETKENIERILFEKEQKLIFKILDRYPVDSKPTIDQFLNKLIIHAFLDRKGESDHQIGFVNEFILGSFIGENLLEQESWISTERFVDFILTAYTPRTTQTKLAIYNKLNSSMIDYLGLEKMIYIDNYLFGSINRQVDSAYISNLEFRKHFNNNCTIDNSSFSDCKFYNVNFTEEMNNVTNTTFINCEFYDCIFPGWNFSEKGILFTNPYITPQTNIKLTPDIQGYPENTTNDKYDFNERLVLEKFWPTGKESLIAYKREGTLKLGIPAENIQGVRIAIDSLIRRGIIIKKRGQHALHLDLEHIQEIKKILGR